MSFAAGINLDGFAPDVIFPGRAEDSPDEFDDWSAAEDEDDDEPFSEKVRRQIEDDDPDLIKLELGFDGYIPRDGDWEELGLKIGRSKHLRQILFYDLDGEVITGDFSTLFHGVALNRSISKLSLQRCGLFDSDIFSTLIPLFKGSRGFESLKINGCELGLQGLRLLTAALAKFDSLKEFELSRCGIVNDGSYLQALAGHPGLWKLTLRTNRIGRTGCASLAALIQKPNVRLDMLTLADNGFTDDCFAELATGLIKNSFLRDLDLSRNHHVTETGWGAIFATLKSPSCKLEKLYLQENRISDASAVSLAIALAANRTIKTLGLSCCRNIKSAGWTALFQFLQGPCCTLEELHLLSNGLRNDAMYFLAYCLSNNRSLTNLNLSANRNIGLSRWQAFSSVLLSPRSTLNSIDLSYNQINDEAAISIGNALANNTRLRELKLCHNPQVSTAGWQAFSAALQNPHSALEKLDLSGNPINDGTMISLANSLAKNTKMTELLTHFFNWNVTANGWAALSRALCNKSSTNKTFGSNHTLRRLCKNGMEGVLPGCVRSLLVLNREKGRSQAARLKIINFHFSRSFSIRPFLNMKSGVLPHAVAWMAKKFVGDGEGVEVGGISLLYRFVQSMHLLIGFGGESKSDVAGPKRKRRRVIM